MRLALLALLVVAADGRLHLVYELRVTNTGSKPRALSGLDIFGERTAAPLLTLSNDSLKSIAHLVGAAKPDEDGRVLAAGRQALLYIWVTVPAGASVPARLHHRFIVSPADSVTATRRDTLDGPDVPVAHPAVVISAPFAGGPWYAANGPGNTSGHRLTVVPLGGLARIPQRFATDWVKFGPEGRLFHGDSSINANWYGYGTPIVAVGDGVVTETLDSVIENVPLAPTRAVPITLVTVAGNHVLLDLGGGDRPPWQLWQLRRAAPALPTDGPELPAGLRGDTVRLRALRAAGSLATVG